ncbi:MAG: RnfABCDGE type electron transport complex subunit D [Treponema lecithinolyticum]|uniref:RnfABCDGE type electron transport complex subunit D n=1 Tax=Treponema lecithinolyticum TaxID=53418 RepID=UPI00360A5771
MSAAFDTNNLYMTPSPHCTAERTTQSTMLLVIAALLPITVYGIVLFGVPALVTVAVSTVSCVVFELLIQKLFKRPVRINDLSAVVTGLLLALALPPAIPVWMTVLGALFAIVIAKEFFGGIGSNVFNPALAGRAFLFVSFPAAMGARWIDPATDAVSAATVLSQIKEGSASFSAADYLQYFTGNRAGCIGETSAALILLAAAFLLVIKIIDWRAPLSMIVFAAVPSFIAGGDIVASVLTGGLLFGAVFMATDYSTAPVTPYGRFVFGALCGLITFLIRKFGGYPEGVMFSILITNAITPFLNKIIGRKYGHPALFERKKTEKANGGAK